MTFVRQLMRLLTAGSLVLACGCGFTPDLVVVRPDSPVVLVESKGSYVRVMAYSKSRTKLVHVGWVPVDDYMNWTLVRYDWELRSEKDGDGTD